jgi:hypothetical protein
MKSFVTLAVLASISVVGADVRADDPSPEEIARRSLGCSLVSLEGAEVTATMKLVDAGGATQSRSLVVVSKRVGAKLRSVTRFTAPASIAGTAFLSVQNDGRADDQYVFLPKMNNTRRIGADSDRGASFLGTDFSYDDLNRKDARDATYKRLGDEVVDGAPCWVLEAVPKVPGRYARSIVRIRKTDFAPMRTDAYGTGGELVKTVRLVKVATFGGRQVASEIVAEDAKTHHRTVLAIDKVRFDVPIGDAELVPTALAR